MGGFEVGGNVARLEFADGSTLDGATVRVSLDMSVRDFYGLRRAFRDAPDEEQVRFYETFGDDYLLGWDVMLKGEALPPDGEGMLSLPIRAAGELFVAWMAAMADVTPNSGAASVNGATSEAAYEATAAS